MPITNTTQNIKKSKGFTLIELMIVIAIIGILTAIAVPAYNGYIESARAAKMTSHFEEGVRLVRAEFARHTANIATGGTGTIGDCAALRTRLNEGDATAPVGTGDPYAATADADTGQIGVACTDDGDGFASNVIFTRLNAFNVAESTITIE